MSLRECTSHCSRILNPGRFRLSTSRTTENNSTRETRLGDVEIPPRVRPCWRLVLTQLTQCRSRFDIPRHRHRVSQHSLARIRSSTKHPCLPDHLRRGSSQRVGSGLAWFLESSVSDQWSYRDTHASVTTRLLVIKGA